MMTLSKKNIYIIGVIIAGIMFVKGKAMQLKRINLSKEDLRNVDRWRNQAKTASSFTGVPVNVILAIIAIESRGLPEAVGDNGTAFGLMQIRSIAYQDLGHDENDEVPMDPEENIIAGARFIALQYSRMSSEYTLLREIWFNTYRAYNAGAQGALNNPGLSDWYAREVKRYSRIFKRDSDNV